MYVIKNMKNNSYFPINQVVLDSEKILKEISELDAKKCQLESEIDEIFTSVRSFDI